MNVSRFTWILNKRANVIPQSRQFSVIGLLETAESVGAVAKMNMSIWKSPVNRTSNIWLNSNIGTKCEIGIKKSRLFFDGSNPTLCGSNRSLADPLAED
jgi:hypothetical protein